ncbi:MAG: glycine cleavage system protein GcvH [Halanaerobiales bacterium]
MEVPEGYFYTKKHEWVKVSNNEAKIGITEYAGEELGDIVFVELPEVGEELDQFEQFAVIESVKAVSDVFAPISGEVVAINQNLQEEPELINDYPYDEGWLIKIQITDEGEKEELMDSYEYSEFIEEE